MYRPLPFARRAASALLLLVVGGCLSGTEPASGTPSNPATETFATSLGVNLSQMTKVSDDLYYQDLVVGTGAQAAAGKTVSVTYTGWLVNGTVFDTNVGKPVFPFILGIGQVITGWDVGVAGMKVGGKRRLVIGSNLGYGGSGNGPIPPNATLVFDVQVASVQ
jgi:FKBP-type peptidyl-prolyl cis-trans isomerase